MFYQIEERARFSFEGGLCPSDGNPDAWISTDPEEIDHAKSVCRQCPIMSQCLDHSVVNDERFGVWGGRDHDERGFHHRTRF